MLTKNNKKIITKNVPRFGFRKFSVGLAGVMLGTSLALANTNTKTVKADVVPDNPNQVNTQPTGEKAAQAELKQVDDTPTNVQVESKATQKAPTTQTTKAFTVQTQQTVQQNRPKQTAPQQNIQKPAEQTAATPVNQANIVSEKPKTSQQVPQHNIQNPGDSQSKQSVQHIQTASVNTNPKTDIVPDAPQIAPRTPKKLQARKLNRQKSLPKITQATLLNNQIKTVAGENEIGSKPDDPDYKDHHKTIIRQIHWYVKTSNGDYELTGRQQTVTFGQLWTTNSDGSNKQYIPWEQDPRTKELVAISNEDQLAYIKSNIGTNGLTQGDYDTFKEHLDNDAVDKNGASSDRVTPLSDAFINYDIYFTPKAPDQIKISVIYRDLDDNQKVLDSKNYQATPGQNLSIAADYNGNLANFTAKGYTHNPKDDTLPNGTNISIPDTGYQPSYVYYVGLHHDVREYIPGENNPKTGLNDDANLVKKVTQTIKYVGTPSPLPDNKQTIEFDRHGIVDMVTGQTSYKDWNKPSDSYKDVTSPTVDNLVPDQLVVKGTTVTPTSLNSTKTVTYAPADTMRDVVIHYRYDSWNSDKQVFSDKNRKMSAKTDSSGNIILPDNSAFNQDIIAKDGYTASVVHTNVQGGTIHAWIVYVKNPENNLTIHFIDQDNNNQPVPNIPNVTGNNVIGAPIQKPSGINDILDKLDKAGYEIVKDPFQNPPTATNGQQDVNYVVKHKKTPVNPETTRNEIVHFVDENGNKLAPDQTQSAKFQHHGVTDLVTGETTWTDWSPNQTTNPINVPVINGYVTDSKQVPSQTLTPDKDIELTVKYHKVGQFIPTDPNGVPIQGAPHKDYINDPTDPTKVKPDETVPDVPGYTPETPTATPTDPTKDTPIKYHKNETPIPPKNDTSLNIIVHDDDTNKDLPDYGWNSGTVTPGGKVDYNWPNEKQKLIDHGYVVNEEPNIPNNYGDSSQVITIHVKHGQIHVNPDHPQTPGGKINKGDATWPDKNQYEHNRQYVVHFVDSKGHKLAPDQTQTMQFGRDLIIDTVTGKILNPDAKWTPKNDHYADIQAMNINGYKVNNKSMSGVNLINGKLPGALAIDSDLADSIVYTANNDQVPEDPGNGGKNPNKGNDYLGDQAKDKTPQKPASKAPAQQAARSTGPAKANKASIANAKNKATAPARHMTNKQIAAQVQTTKQAGILPQTGKDSNQALALSILGVSLALLSLASGIDPKQLKRKIK